MLSPAAFLPLIEGTALEIAFGTWVVDTALEMAQTLHAQGLNLTVSINITAPHLQQPDFAPWMASRLAAAKAFQRQRLDFIARHWLNSRTLADQDFKLSEARLNSALTASRQHIDAAPDNTALLTEEARLSKQLFKLAVDAVEYGEFTRAKRGSGADPANRFLDHGNYLAYGLGATAAWVLGLPHGLAILHGKTRRGGLVFDIADLVKDALVLPQAFISAQRGDDEQAFRQACITRFTQAEALDFMIDTVKAVALAQGMAA